MDTYHYCQWIIIFSSREERVGVKFSGELAAYVWPHNYGGGPFAIPPNVLQIALRFQLQNE